MQAAAFHPVIRRWFDETFEAPTRCQARAWSAIATGGHTLVAAPTGSGKTLAAFLTVIDQLVRAGLEGSLDDGVHVVYVSPLKALSNDIERNLAAPLTAIQARLAHEGFGDVALRTAVRTGDTPQPLRALMRRRPPHVLVTTPESLYILLSSDSGREMLRSTRTVIVDEIHALAGTKRGAHLGLSLERLCALTATRPQRIGLSATQRPLADVARFLIGEAAVDSAPACEIIDEGHVRDRDLAVELPRAPLETVLSGDSAADIYDRMATLIGEHRTTLIFVNTRRLAERVAKALSDRLGSAAVASHHGSMARESRLLAESRLKNGELRALVATASLELGIDIGDVDLVCQLGTTRTLSALLQRVGRSGHRLGAVAKGRLFPQTRDELTECAALLAMNRRGELDQIRIVGPALDVLAQQIVAEVASREYDVDELFALSRRAYPYRDLDLGTFERVLGMLAEGYSFAHGRRSAYLHFDRINRKLRGRAGARLVAVTCGGAIPDNADYDVVVDPSGHVVGTVNEDFAIESMPGDIFQLGNRSWRVLKVDPSAIRVADAEGQPPNIPFWLGEAPARSRELSVALSRLRDEFARRVDTMPIEAGRHELIDWLMAETGLDTCAATQLYEYLLSGYRSLGAMPTQDTLVLERFFDESGGMQLVIHSPFGSRINRAWGLALRKRFCRQFNFELQAAAVEDAIVISLGAVHSFPLADVWRFLQADTVRDVLVQALLAAPMFTIRWRWVACCALALQRFRAGRKTPPRLLRMQAEDLVAVIFPDQLACAENLQGRRTVPDHPLVTQAVDDCLNDAMDVEGLESLLRAIERGEKTLLSRDLTSPSPFSQAVLNANPYAFLDDAPLEERRTQAVQSRRWIDPDTARDLAELDPAAIARVRDDVWPVPRDADELHEALALLGFVDAQRFAPPWAPAGGARALTQDPDFERLVATGRARALRVGDRPHVVCCATENLELLRALHPATAFADEEMSPGVEPGLSPEEALLRVVRGWLDLSGPCTAAQLAAPLLVPEPEIRQALLALEARGIVFRGRFTSPTSEDEWCERRLLSRIHRLTVDRLRAEIEPVPAACYLRFLFDWQYVAPGAQVRGEEALHKVLELLSGFESAAVAWESELLPSRIADYGPDLLDRATAGGKFIWTRLSPRPGEGRGGAPTRATPLAIVARGELTAWRYFGAASSADVPRSLSGAGERVLACLQTSGASFFEDLVIESGLLRTQCEAALGELVARGLATADGYQGLRALLTPSARRKPFHGTRRQRGGAVSLDDAGRWHALRAVPSGLDAAAREELIERIARSLLRRYGVVMKRIIERESCVPPWRELLYCLRRLEARGEIRGGRFIAGFSGEQFALPEAVGLLRAKRTEATNAEVVVLSASDPLNVAGILTPGVRIPALHGARVAFLDGEPVAVRVSGEIRLLRTLESRQEVRVRTALSSSRAPARLRAYLRR